MPYCRSRPATVLAPRFKAGGTRLSPLLPTMRWRSLTPACHFRDTIMTNDIHRSAHKHGATDADIRHAIENAMVVADIDDGIVLYIGPDLAANLLEVIAVTKDDDDELVIHAMALRRKYRPLLQGLEAADD